MMIPTSQKTFESFEYELPNTASRDLNKTYYEMRSRVIESGNARPINVLLDPSFESENIAKGWTTGNPLDRLLNTVESGVEGVRALELKNPGNETVWVRSNKFAAPETGRLSLSVWLRTAGPCQTTAVADLY